MAIDTLAKLKARLGFLANRDDLFSAIDIGVITIDDAISTAIANSTTTLSRDLAKRGGTGLQEFVDDTLTTTANSETVTLTANTAGVKVFAVTTNPYQLLQPKDISTLFNDNLSTATSKPTAYTILRRTTAYLRPIPDATYNLRLVGFKDLVALTSTVTNAVFDSHPDIYEAAGMVELGLVLEDDASVQKWRVVYDQKLDDLTGQDKMSGWAAAMSGAMPSVQVNIA